MAPKWRIESWKVSPEGRKKIGDRRPLLGLKIGFWRWNRVWLVGHYLTLDYKNLLFLKNFNQSISGLSQSSTKILLVDLTSAEKIITTIREDFWKIYFSTTFFCLRKSQSFQQKKCGFFEKKNSFQILFFIHSSRMVKLIFSADAKSISRICFSLRKSGDIGCLNFSKRVGFCNRESNNDQPVNMFFNSLRMA